jgi:hypothetical protein
MQQTTPTDVVSPSLLATVADRCPNCDAPMAADQRYCTECGQRRGQPRLPFMDGRTRPAAVAGAAAKASKPASGAGTAGKSSPSTAAKPTAAAKKAPKVVKLGDKCTGRGCTNGKFTGDFFGGG